MIVCKQFVFVHLPKTGGTFVRDTLKTHQHASWQLRERPGHHPARTGPRDRPILGIIRNPWDWYVSSYFFRRNNILNSLGAWRKPRDQWLSGMLQWEKIIRGQPEGTAGFRESLALMTRVAAGELKGSDYVALPAEDGRLTWRHNEYLCDEDAEPICDVAKFESLRVDVEAFLSRHSIPLSTNLLAALHSNPKKNVSPRGAYREYYDDAGRELVANVDRSIIERYGYEF